MGYQRKIQIRKEKSWINYIVVAGLLIFFLLGFSFYILPFVRYYQMEQAIAAGDAGAVINYIDTAELKRNILKRQKSVFIEKKGTPLGGGPVTLVDLAVKWYERISSPDFERFFTTQGIYALMGELEKGKPEEEGVFALASRVISNSSFEYQSLDRFSIKVKDMRGRFVGYVTFDFAREGVNWQLVDIKFPLF
ncbi:MAG: DUF2939 domain-containing protein [Syntrophales bacterium]|nr:DUF2939 domain-containing protein [Syntrophales bacterium]